MDSRSFLGPTSNEVVEKKPAAIYGFDPGPVKAMACKILLQFLRPLFVFFLRRNEGPISLLNCAACNMEQNGRRKG